MKTDYSIKKPNDLSSVNTAHMGELLWWSYQLSCAPEMLIAIVNKVGNSVSAIKEELKNNRHTI
jgi:hypothetical protein